MAAPNTVYKDFKTRRRKAGTPDVDIDLFIAKFLQNTTPPSGDNWGDGYFNSTDTEAQKIAKIKDIFKIDGWVNADTPIQKAGTITISGTSVTGSGTAFPTDFVVGQRVGALVLTDGVLKCVETYIITAITSDTAMSVVAGTNRSGIAYANYHQGFIGYCNSRTSGNGLYHKTERFSGVRVPTTVNASAELLNDAGLNRMGEVSGISIKSFLVQGGIKLSAKYRSSFYNSTTYTGIYFKLSESGDAYQKDFAQTIAPKIALQLTDYVVSNLDAENLVAGNYIYIAPYITNEEGKKVFAYSSVRILPYLELFKYNSAQDASIDLVRGSGAPTADTYLGFATFVKYVNDLAYQPINPEVEPDDITDFEPAELGTYVSNDIVSEYDVVSVNYYRVGLNGSSQSILTALGSYIPIFLIEEEFAMSDASFSGGIYVPGAVPVSQLDAEDIADDLAKNYSIGQEMSVFRNDNIADIGDAREKWYAASELSVSTPLATGTYIQEEPLDSTKYYFKSYGTSGKVIYFGNNITKPSGWL